MEKLHFCTRKKVKLILVNVGLFYFTVILFSNFLVKEIRTENQVVYVENLVNTSIINDVLNGDGVSNSSSLGDLISDDWIEEFDPMQLVLNIHSHLSTPEMYCRRLKDVGGTLNCNDCKRCTRDGYKPICFSEPFRPNRQDCSVLSFGVGYDLSFDRAMANYGCKVLAFDFSVANWTHHKIQNNIHFSTVALQRRDRTNIVMNLVSVENITLPSRVVSELSLKSVLNIFDLTNKTIDILKLDIETNEWSVFDSILQHNPKLIQNVKQLVIEIHLEDLSSLNSNYDALPRVRRVLRVLNELRRTGFKLVRWIHNELSRLVVSIRGRSISTYQEVLYLNQKFEHK